MKAKLDLAKEVLSDTAGMAIDVDVFDQIARAERDIMHNERTLQVLPFVPDIKLFRFGWEMDRFRDNTLRNLERQYNDLSNLRQLTGDHTSRGVATDNIKRAFLDKGVWPVYSWFGLAYVVQ